MLPMLQHAVATQNVALALTTGQLIATAQGAFDRGRSEDNTIPRTLIEACTNEPVESFAAWMANAWSHAEQSQSSRGTSQS